MNDLTKAITPTLCIYHGNCADGFAAAWVVWKLFPDIMFFPGVYGQPLPDCTGHDVLFVDFSCSRSLMAEIANVAKSVTVIDHHKTAQADIEEMIVDGSISGIFDMEKSGAVLTWEWFHPGEPAPQLLQHIQDRDLWKFNLGGTREIQAALFSHPYDFELWDGLIRLGERAIADLMKEGVAIERKHFKDIDELVKVCCSTMEIGGYRVPVANLPYTLASDACHSMAKFSMVKDPSQEGVAEPVAFAGSYYINDRNKAIFSLRSIGDFDVSAIAKQYGGGGHKNAAGFGVSLQDLLKMMGDL